jgi:hypothetical protein
VLCLQRLLNGFDRDQLKQQQQQQKQQQQQQHHLRYN